MSWGAVVDRVRSGRTQVTVCSRAKLGLPGLLVILRWGECDTELGDRTDMRLARI